MGTISTGVGLISGLPIQDLVNSLIAVQARPRTLLQQRVTGIQTLRTAYLELNARLLAVKNAIAPFSQTDAFRSFKATSSDGTVLTASADSSAAVGSFGFVVKSLVSNHQIVSAGMPDAKATGIGTGTVSVEIGEGRLNRSTSLDLLNGQQGVRRGRVRITDAAGGSAEIDLRTALTVDDVLDAINRAEGIQVSAVAGGDGLILTDQSGGAGTFRVQELSGGHTAQDLGILKSVTGADTIVGNDVIYLSDDTRLALLNDGNGVRGGFGSDLRIIAGGGEDPGLGFDVFLDGNLRGLSTDPAIGTRLAQLNHGAGVDLGTIRITDRAGHSVEIDLSAVDRGPDAKGLNQTTVQDVVNKINAELDTAGVNVRVSSPSGNSSSLSLTDSTDVETLSQAQRGNLIVEDLDGAAAADLGITADTGGDSFNGAQILHVDTIGDVTRAINFADGNVAGANYVTASIAGNGLQLSSDAEVTVELSDAARDLGFADMTSGLNPQTRDLLGGLNTVLLRSLNGGKGVRGQLDITARDGVSSLSLDLSGMQTSQDLIEAINSQSTSSQIQARINAAGNGIEILDLTSGSGPLSISGSAAEALGIAGEHRKESATANAQLQYISSASELEALNHGKGISRGRFKITNSNGVTQTVDLTQGDERTLQDVIDEINSRFGAGQKVEARINDQGDGLLLIDKAGGTQALKVEEDGSTTAADLNILGTATQKNAEDQFFLDGTHEYAVKVTAGDSMNSLASKLREATGGRVNATVINDGSATNPYRLSLTSRVGGARGVLSFDTHEIEMETGTLIEARDAVVLLGGESATNNILITSSSNTIKDIVSGVTLNLLSASDKAATVTVEKDVESVVSDIQTFVSAYNSVADRIGELTSFDPETEQRGILLGESTVSTIQNRLSGMILSPLPGSPGEFRNLAPLGLSLGSGGRLEFDPEKFRRVLEDDPELVETIFAEGETGVAGRFEDVLDQLTNEVDGLLAARDDVLANREEDLTDRIEIMTQRLEARRQMLTAEFNAMERTLSLLQSQQSSLAGLSALTQS